ncbi:hypothetical protein JCM11641_008138 [Rhodosporidiobolus odoratus]
MASRQRQSSASHGAPHSTAVTLHFKERNCHKQPLYRPAALRRNVNAVSPDFFHPSPPGSPMLAAAEPKAGWLSSLAPWSPSNPEAGKELGTVYVRGRMLPRAQWKRDEEAEKCADPDCVQRFDLLNRRHHCRTCGDIFCGAHSSRSTLLWPSSEDEPVPFTPRGTPRQTPRSSTVDLPSLAAAYSVSPTSSCISTATASSSTSSSSASTSTLTSSPPNPSAMPCPARVCDRCYFSAPTASGAPAPLLTPPILPAHVPWAFGAASSSSRPLSLHHPRGSSQSRSRSRASSPSGGGNSDSPPSGMNGLNRVKSRSRQGSAASLSSSSAAGSATAWSEYSTPSTSVEVLASTVQGKRSRSSSTHRRGASPATSLRAHSSGGSVFVSAAPSIVKEENESDTEVEEDAELPTPTGSGERDDSDDEEQHEATMRERRRMQQEYGSVQGQTWGEWSTF